MANGKVDGGRRGYQGGKDSPHGPKSQSESDTVIKCAFVLQSGDLLFVPAGLKAAHAYRASIQFHSTDGTQQTAACRASVKSLHTQMVEALRLALLYYVISAQCFFAAQECIENIRAQSHPASRTRCHASRVDVINRLDGSAIGTSDHDASQFYFL